MNKRMISRLLSMVLAIVMIATMAPLTVFAAESTGFKAPTKPMEIDKSQITIAAHSMGFTLPEILGLNNQTSTESSAASFLVPKFAKNSSAGANEMSLAKAQQKPLLGVFGSDINDCPNPYLYNYFYNAYATENDLDLVPESDFTRSRDVPQGPSFADNSTGYTDPVSGDTISGSLFGRPDILLGVGPDRNGKDYTEALANLPENKGKEPANYDYKPEQVPYICTTTYDFLKTMYLVSDAVTKIKNEDSTRTTRYEDPALITSNIEKFVKGTQAYVIKQLNENSADKKVVAIIDWNQTNTLRASDKLAENEYIINTYNMSTQNTVSVCRVAEFVADISTDITNLDEFPVREATISSEAAGTADQKFYVATADQIAEYVDVVLFMSVVIDMTKPDTTFVTDLIEKASADYKDKAKNVNVQTAAFSTVGSIGANSAENLLGMAYYAGYLYPEYINQFDIATYWYKHFYHVSDNDALASAITTNFGNSSKLKGCTYTPDVNSFDENALEAKIISGMHYYESNKDLFADTKLNQDARTGEKGWNIDWTTGIGSDFTGLQKVDGVWSFIKDGVVDETYTGLADNAYGTWYVVDGTISFVTGMYKMPSTSLAKANTWIYLENGKFTGRYTGMAKNDYGWWYIKNSVIDQTYTGMAKNDYGWWYMKNGKLDTSYTGMAKNDYGWWHMTKGKLDTSFTGIDKNEYGSWYMKNGKLQSNYTGKVTVSGKTYNIKNGKVV